MTTDQATPTIEELAEQIGMVFGRCEVAIGIIKPMWNCKRRAAHVVMFTCPEHGSHHTRLCRLHLRLLRWGVLGKPRCHVCHRAGKWKEGD